MILSIVIPAHNEERYLGRCLDSIERELRDAPVRVEVIVVNNASTDKTAEVARAYRAVKVVNESRKGIVWARRAGFIESTGDIIANIDADSMLSEGWIKKVVKEFSNDPKLVGLSGPFVHYDLSWPMRLLVRLWYVIVFASHAFMKTLFNTGAFLQGGNYVMRRGAFETAGGYNTNIEFYGEDSDVARRLCKIGKVKFSFKLPMYSSGRRLLKEGMFTTAFHYARNYTWGVLFKKSFDQTSKDIR